MRCQFNFVTRHFQCLSECIFNETGIMKDRVFRPEVTLELAKKALGPNQTWMPVVEDAVQTCNEHGLSPILRVYTI